MRKFLRLALALLAAQLALPSLGLAIPATTSDPRAIVEAMEARDTGSSSTLKLSITIADKAGRERTRLVQVRSMKTPEATRQLILFEKPADLRNAGFLSVDYNEGGRADDQWLYLPSLGRTTRIASADKSGSFMGTDLTYSDMTRKDPDAYEYRMVQQSVVVDGEDCWLIEATPRTAKEKKETGYAKSQLWVSKDKLIAVRIKAYVVEGKRLKFTQLSDFRQVDGVWVAHKVVVRTMRNGEVESVSTLVTSDLVLNAKTVQASDFTEQRLERGL
jgi:hypothetical protein